jgi:predicted transposase/invertase (TIGR01784 family)
MIEMIAAEKPADYGQEPATPDYDGLWKKIIGELFEEFTAFFAPALYEEIDFSADFDVLQQELHQEIMKKKAGKAFADKLFKVFLKDGKEKWVLIHVEVQDENQQDFPERMFRYFYRIYDRFNREIFAVALMTDVSQKADPGRFSYSFYGTEVDYRYHMYDFHGKDIEQLERSTNPFATAVIAGIYASRSKKDSDMRYTLKRSLITSILKKYDTAEGITIEHLNKLVYFVDCLLQLTDEMNDKLRIDLDPYLGKEVKTKMRAEKTEQPPTLAELIEEGKLEGRQEGKLEGRQEGKQEGGRETRESIVKVMLREKYAVQEIMKITGLSEDEIKEIQKHMQ